MAHDPSLFAGGAALHALDQDEDTAFEHHLEHCSTCQAELTGFQETAARLGSASAEAPPASMRAAVLAGIAVTRQLPPDVQLADPVTDRLPAAGPTSTDNADPGPAHAEPRLAEVVELASRRRPTARIMVAASAVLVALVAIGISMFGNRNTVQSADALRTCVESASDQRQPAAAADSVGSSSVTVSASCGAALVQLSSIPAAPAGRTYQLWVIAGSEARSVGTMTPDGAGTMPDVIAAVHVGDTAIGVTVEPAGGSVAPTTSPIIVVPLSV